LSITIFKYGVDEMKRCNDSGNTKNEKTRFSIRSQLEKIMKHIPGCSNLRLLERSAWVALGKACRDNAVLDYVCRVSIEFLQ